MERALPLIILLNDGASSHTSCKTTDSLLQAVVEIILWPPCSSDLKSAECVRDIMKSDNQDHYSELAVEIKISELRLRKVIGDAWELITT